MTLGHTNPNLSSGSIDIDLDGGGGKILRGWSPILIKVGIPNFVSGPREYIMEGEYVILAMCSWFRIS